MVSFTPQPLYPLERTPDIYWIIGRVDPGAGVDDIKK
jgi:hypothetical protein